MGRNDRCPCGSGRKYKRCHGDGISGEYVGVDLSSLAYTERWLLLIRECHRLLDLPRMFTAEDVRQAFELRHVVEINTVYDRVFNSFANPYETPRSKTDRLGALYLGDIAEKKISRNLLRMSLYADEIYVADPFFNPRMQVPNGGSPLKNPDFFATATYQAVYFILRLAPWIESGIVIPLLNPMNFDNNYRYKVIEDARAHADVNMDKTLFDAEFKKKMLDLDMYDQLLLGVPDENLADNIKSLMPEMPNSVAVDLGRIVANSRRGRYDLPDPAKMAGLSGQFLLQRGGFDIITSALLCSKLNAFPFAEEQARLKLMDKLYNERNPVAELWTPVAGAFAASTLGFLNQVEPDFAIGLRKDGRLHGFRQFLRTVWGQASGGSGSPNPQQILGFCDELRNQYEKAEVEWREIEAAAIKWGVYSAGAILGGSLVLNVPGFIAAGGVLVEAYQHWHKGKGFRIRNPASVLIDLKNDAGAAGGAGTTLY